MGLDVHIGEECLPSSKGTEFLWNLGYLRSSYNDSGFNNVCRTLIGKDLYWVFEPNDEYEFVPDWDAALMRARQLLSELRESRPFQVATVSHNTFAGVSKVTREEAIAKLREELAREKPPFDGGSYSCLNGWFFLGEPMKVIAAIPGTDCLGSPCVHLITEIEPEEDGENWYVKCAEVLIEVCEYHRTRGTKVEWSS